MAPKTAFLTGFRKGLSAPFALFLPDEGGDTAKLELIQVKTTKFKSIEEAWADSWAKIGQDMYRAMGYVAEKAK
jgi:hypothetical protein